ncbi:hypothetical protein [Geomonas sp.]|uniref:hypothetical protein n=1 Tax=Geomonas sp. TaxID=2651584 RepID=UPI002B4A96C6|nr:hypothetical protein [Geomonas sp.]HJV34867.1 hypothetical protein [Geomonas sp.]
MFGQKKYRRFLCLFFVFTPLLCGMAAAVNYYIDPMWCFRHANRYNGVQCDIDDRQQKTNYLKCRAGEGYDTLMIGNSRVMLMNQNDFGPHTFNYAVAGMLPIEFPEYINYAKKVNGKSFQRIVIGLSFAPTNEECSYFAGKAPSYYFKNADNPLYRYGLLFSRDVLNKSLYNYHNSSRFGVTVYTDRYNVRHVRKERVKLEENLRANLEDTVNSYRNHFRYLEGYRSILESIKKDNPGTDFKVFTTPVSKPLFCAVVNEGRLPDYERWLRESVEVFGEVQHFEYLNSVTRNYQSYYMDGHHYYPEAGTLIAHKVMGVADQAIPADFGMLVTRANIDEKLKEIEASAAECAVTAGGKAPAGLALPAPATGKSTAAP